MHKVNILEAQRVIAVLDDAAEKLQYLSYTPPEPSSELNAALSEAGLQPLASQLQQLWRAEQATGEVVTASDYGGAYGWTEPQFADSGSNQNQQHTRALCRMLRKTPIGLEIMMQLKGSERSLPLLNFIQCTSDLKVVVYNKLSTTVEEEASTKSYLHELDERKSNSEENRKQLQETLEHRRREKETELSSLEQTLSKFTAELQDITQTNALEMDAISKDLENTISRASNDHGDSTKQLIERAEQLRKHLTTLSAEHRESEAVLRKKKNRAEEQLAKQIQDYDQHMINKQKEIEEMKERIKEETEALELLQEHFDRVDANAAQTEEEERVLRAIQAREAAAQAQLDKAAQIVQKHVRGRQTRMEFAKIKKKKQKGGKKKGKGKKGAKKK